MLSYGSSPVVETYAMLDSCIEGTFIEKGFLKDFEILGWCPVGPVLPHGEKVPLYHPSSDGVTIKMLYGVDVLH